PVQPKTTPPPTAGTVTVGGKTYPNYVYTWASQPTSNYQDILKNVFGGDPARYAAEIQRKEQQGLALSDPAAAAAFKQAYPQYFNTAQQPGVQQQTQAQVQQQARYSLPQDVLSQLSQPLQQYSFQGEQLLRDLLARMPVYQQPSQEELLQQAKTWANLQVDPTIQAISQSLAQTKQALETQQAKTEAAYAGLDQSTQRFMQEAARQALESAIARGGGRSGQVEWYTSKLQQPIAEQYAQAQAQKAAELADIANRMTLAEQQAAEQQKALEQRRGELEAERLSELQNLAHATAVGDWQRAFEAAQNLAAMATQAQQWGLNYAAGLLPYFTLTESERQNLPL
ncbi:MAG: hypothetical protein ACPLSX_04265, partial [Arcobacter sp.]